MNNTKEYMTEEGYILKPYPEEKEEISISIPKLTYETLEKIAERKELPVKALIKFYVSQGMREDLTKKEAKELTLKRLKSRKKNKSKTEVDLAA